MENNYGTVSAFIDASNLWEIQKAKGKFFDYQKLINYLKDVYATENVRVFYYTAYPADGTRSYSIDGKHKFFTYLNKGLGFTVRKKELKQIKVQTEDGGAVEEKGNMDVELVIDALHNVSNYNTALFFTGDSDFLALASYLMRGGKKVFIYSSRNNISSELRTGANGYIDLLKIKEDVWGNPLQRRK